MPVRPKRNMIDPRDPDFSNTPVSPRRPAYGYQTGDSAAPPVVSVVTPFFNTGAVFLETVETVRRQSLQQWEWIIVDDGSDQAGSLAALDACVSQEPRVRVVRSEGRLGPAAARNLGVAQSRAPYVAFIDSDDLLEPTALEKWLWFLECRPQYGMVKGYQAGFGAEGYIWREGFHSGAAILENNIIQTASMIRREVYLAAGGMDESIQGGMEDWDFWLRCAEAGYWGGTVPEVLDWYRRRESHQDRWEDWDRGARQSRFREELRRRHPKVFRDGPPQPETSYPLPYSNLPESPAFENRLARRSGVHRVLLIVPHLVMGGSDKFTLDLAAQLIRRHGCEITIASTLASGHDWRHRFEELTPDVFTLDTLLPLRDYPRFLAYLIRSRGIDSIVVTHSQLGYQLLPYLRAQFPSLGYYDYLHLEEPSWKDGGYPAYSLSYGAFLDRTLVSSQHLKGWMSDRGADAGRISVVTTNIDPGEWRRDEFDSATLRDKWDIDPDVPVILFAGRLCEQKQPHVLAAAICELEQRGIRFQCLVAGDGERAAWLQEFQRKHRLGRLRLLGSRANEEIRELMAVSDIFFLPSRHEGISLALYEAMAMSMVVVGADVGGQRELVTPECGVLIARGGNEAQVYAGALASLLADAGRRRRMAECARRRIVEHFSLDDMGTAMADILRTTPRDPSFDATKVFARFASSHAREIIEQRRVEQIADHLWMERGLGGPAAAQGPAPGRERWMRLYRSAALLGPLLVGSAHRHNRRLLWSTLSRRAERRELRRCFDKAFYCYSNPDVPAYGPLPLLHYVFYGYRENRRPAPDFESGVLHEASMKQMDVRVNPLLRRLALRRDNRSARLEIMREAGEPE